MGGQIQAVSKEDELASGGGVDLFSPPQDLLVDANAEWQCAMCASINKAESEQCGACTYSKAKSVQSFMNIQEEKAQIAAALAASQADQEKVAIEQVEKAAKEDDKDKDEIAVKDDDN